MQCTLIYSRSDEFSEEEEGSNAPAVLKSNETRLEPSILLPTSYYYMNEISDGLKSCTSTSLILLCTSSPLFVLLINPLLVYFYQA